MKDNPLLKNAEQLAIDIETLCKTLERKDNSNAIFQIRKSSSSVFANITEAQYPQSLPDMLSKFKIARKECVETESWLKLLYSNNYIDEEILENGTAYITDVGMTGPKKSVIGMDVDASIKRFETSLPEKYKIAEGNLAIIGSMASHEVLESDIENLTLRYITHRLTEGEIRQNYYFFGKLKTERPLQSTEGELHWFTYEEAEFILKQINAQRPPYRPQLDSEGKPKFAPPPRYKIVELPWLNRIADKKVSDNE